MEEYHQVLQDASGSRIFSLEELQEVGEVVPAQEGLPRNRHTEGPLDGLSREAFRGALAEAIAGLPERERLVIALYYDEELNLREIGQILGVSESRVCQIHGQAAMRLRSRLGDWLPEPGED
jgi:RNA polymerase sigma factor for flagellar operon FliA